MRSKVSAADYLYFLSVKYKVGFDSLFKGLVLARENSEVPCGKLTIQCRQKARNHEVFLITCGYKVVAQFFVPKYLLDNPNQIEEPKLASWFRRASKQNSLDKPKSIGDLQCGMKRINLKARVLDVPKAVPVFTRYGGYARVSNALIADETGAIKLCLWNEKINRVTVDSVIQIENATVTRFRGENQLRLGRNAKLSVVEETDFPLRMHNHRSN
jgi:hypothetical protein